MYKLIYLFLAAPPFTERLAEGIKSLLELIKGIANPVGAVAIGACGLYLIVGSDPATIRKVKTWLISIVAGMLIINFAQQIMDWIQSLA